MMSWNTKTTALLGVITGEILKVVDHYTELGAFEPKRAQTLVPYAERVRYAGSGRHHASRSRRPLAWVSSRLRDAGDWAFGSFRFLAE